MAGSGLAGPYEHPAMRETLGTALRPGGLVLDAMPERGRAHALAVADKAARMARAINARRAPAQRLANALRAKARIEAEIGASLEGAFFNVD